MASPLVAAYQHNLEIQELTLLRFLIAFTRKTLDPRAADRTWAAWSTGTSLLLLAAQDKAFDAALKYFHDATVKATGDLPQVVLARPEPDADRILAALRITGPITIKQAATAGLPVDAALARALSRTARFATSVVEDRATDTLWSGMSAEPSCVGYHRVISPKACSRCQVVSTTKRVFSVTPSPASRGLPAGYFWRHPGCKCTAEPVYRTDTGVAPRETPKIVPLDLVSERAPLLN